MKQTGNPGCVYKVRWTGNLLFLNKALEDVYESYRGERLSQSEDRLAWTAGIPSTEQETRVVQP